MNIAMKIPDMHGVIERRILLNYRIDPAVAAGLLPPPFEPALVRGCAIMGVCLIRLRKLRPRYWPAGLGLYSENAALRTAVEWDEAGQRRVGVYVSRRDTNSWLNAMLGGRIFPGVQRHAKFRVEETDGRFAVDVTSRDGAMDLSLRASLAPRFPATSVFGSLAEASRFFRAGSVGYSSTADSGRFDGLEMQCADWPMSPLEVEAVRSAWFDDERRFPPGTIELDCALLMRNVEHTWRSLDELCCDRAAAFQATPQAAGV